jgi:hypothetical protein
MPIYMQVYCDECGLQGDDCCSPFCQLDRMRSSSVDLPEDYDTDHIFVDEIGVLHGPFADFHTTRAAADAYLASIGVVGLTPPEKPLPTRPPFSDSVDVRITVRK